MPHVLDDVRMLELADREVDADPERLGERCTCLELDGPAARLMQTQRPISMIRPVSSASGMKLSGWT